MHIPFEWAKQRPQFLAEFLSKTFEIHLGTYESFRRKNLRKEAVMMPHKRVFTLPFESRSKPLRLANRWLAEKSLSATIQGKEIVWVTHPKVWPGVKRLLSNEQVLIYDCMDNASEFPREKANPVLQREIIELERDMLGRANYTFFSSKTLLETLSRRYGIEGKNWMVLNNGIDPKLVLQMRDYVRHPLTNSQKSHRKLIYVGTVSEWFDFQLIETSLLKFPTLEVHLYGPTEVPIPAQERLVYHGPIPHSEVFPILLGADALIMPFRISTLIESVNPVKLYEYIAAGKPSIAPFYAESAYFQEFTYLYKTPEEWFLLLDRLTQDYLPSKRNLDERLEFCNNNTWESRAQYISSLLLEER